MKCVSEAGIGLLEKQRKIGCDWLLWGTLAVSSLLLILLELRTPYYFLQDDGLDYFLPAYVHNWRALVHGKLALYDFHVLAGVPQLAVGQAGTFYGPQYVAMGLSRLFWGNPFAALDIMAWIHILLAVAGTYVLLKYMGCDGIAAGFAGLSALTGFMLWAGRMWPFVLMLCAWFPWMVWAALRYLERPGVRRAGVLLFFRLALLYGGYPQFFVLAILFEHLLVLAYGLAQRRSAWWITYGGFLLYDLPTALLGLPFLWPVWAQVAVSLQRARPLRYLDYSALHLTPYQWVAGQFCPFISWHLWSNHISSSLPFLSYIGFLPALLPLGLVMLWRRDRAKRAYLIAACVGFLLSWIWVVNFIGPILYHVPVLNRFRWPFKLVYFSGFCECILAALVLTLLSRKWRVIAVLVFIVNWLLVFILLPNHAWRIRHNRVPIHSVWRSYLAQGRYVVVSPTGFYHDMSQYEASNYAELWRQDNLFGYEPLLGFRQALTVSMGHIYGGVERGPLNRDAMRHFYLWSVKYILLGPRRQQYEPLLRAAGFRPVLLRGIWSLWENRHALARVHWNVVALNPGSSAGIRWRESVNSLDIHLRSRLHSRLTLAFANNNGLQVCIRHQCRPVPYSTDGMIHISVPAGVHKVRLVYRNPWLFPACIIAFMTFMVMVWKVIMEERTERRKLFG